MESLELENITEFLQFISTRKRNWSDFQFAHVDISNAGGSLDLGEVEQFMKFHIKADQAYMYRLPNSQELILFAHKDKGLEFSRFEKEIYDNFTGHNINFMYRSMDKNGVEHLAKIVGPRVNQTSSSSQIAYRRMNRMANVIVVLDDDPMVLKSMEKVLSGYGKVVTFQDPEDFIENYKQYSPDVLFLDIHLGSARGNEILRTLKKDIDPHAYVVMISSDTQQNMIIDVKQAGANGFLMKPFNRSKIYQSIIKAPTIVTKSA